MIYQLWQSVTICAMYSSQLTDTIMITFTALVLIFCFLGRSSIVYLSFVWATTKSLLRHISPSRRTDFVVLFYSWRKASSILHSNRLQCNGNGIEQSKQKANATTVKTSTFETFVTFWSDIVLCGKKSAPTPPSPPILRILCSVQQK